MMLAWLYDDDELIVERRRDRPCTGIFSECSKCKLRWCPHCRGDDCPDCYGAGALLEVKSE